MKDYIIPGSDIGFSITTIRENKRPSLLLILDDGGWKPIANFETEAGAIEFEARLDLLIAYLQRGTNERGKIA
jgi:hypothetical protein